MSFLNANEFYLNLGKELKTLLPDAIDLNQDKESALISNFTANDA